MREKTENSGVTVHEGVAHVWPWVSHARQALSLIWSGEPNYSQGEEQEICIVSGEENNTRADPLC